jgi:hypothetical protein
LDIYPSKQRLFYSKRELEDSKTLLDYNIRYQCTIQLITYYPDALKIPIFLKFQTKKEEKSEIQFTNSAMTPFETACYLADLQSFADAHVRDNATRGYGLKDVHDDIALVYPLLCIKKPKKSDQFMKFDSTKINHVGTCNAARKTIAKMCHATNFKPDMIQFYSTFWDMFFERWDDVEFLSEFVYSLMPKGKAVNLQNSKNLGCPEIFFEQKIMSLEKTFMQQEMGTFRHTKAAKVYVQNEGKKKTNILTPELLPTLFAFVQNLKEERREPYESDLDEYNEWLKDGVSTIDSKNIFEKLMWEYFLDMWLKRAQAPTSLEEFSDEERLDRLKDYFAILMVSMGLSDEHFDLLAKLSRVLVVNDLKELRKKSFGQSDSKKNSLNERLDTYWTRAKGKKQFQFLTL